LQSRIDECLERNQLRQGKACIPDAGVRHHHSRLEIPSLEEGFASLHFVRMDHDQFEVEDWTP
jgi:hypothetical protein